MTDTNTVLSLMIIGVISLVITLYLLFTSKKIEPKKKSSERAFDIEISGKRINIILVLYSAIVIILFSIGLLSDFLINSIIGFILASIPIISYLISYKLKCSEEG